MSPGVNNRKRSIRETCGEGGSFNYKDERRYLNSLLAGYNESIPTYGDSYVVIFQIIGQEKVTLAPRRKAIFKLSSLSVG